MFETNLEEKNIIIIPSSVSRFLLEICTLNQFGFINQSVKGLADATPRVSALPVVGLENCYLWCVLSLIPAPAETTSSSFEKKRSKKVFYQIEESTENMDEHSLLLL